jgi:hypothetical protein
MKTNKSIIYSFIIKLMLIFFVLPLADVTSQTVYDFKGRQLIEDAPFYLDITTEDTLVISPVKILVKFAEEREIQGTDFATDSLGLIPFGNLFDMYVFNKPDSVGFIETITRLADNSFFEEVYLDYCLIYPRDIGLSIVDSSMVIELNEGTGMGDCIEQGLLYTDDWTTGGATEYYELAKSKIGVDWTDPPPPPPAPPTDWYCHRAWYYTTGSPEIIVALIDRGLMWDDDDFPPDNGLGWNYVDNTSNVSPHNNYYHIEFGTAHASIIGAKTANKYGFAGVAGGIYIPGEEIVEGTTLMILKATIDENTASSFAAAKSILHAIENNARIINFPWFTSAPPEFFPWLVEALDDAIENNLVVFAPTGDYFFGSTQNVLWPANRDDVIAVGATDADNERATWVYKQGSRFGEATQISLPGDEVYIRNIYGPSGYTQFSSTSIATSIASGIAALMLAENPCLTNQEIKDILIESCVQVGGYDYNHDPNKPGHSLHLGYGLVDAYHAILGVHALFEDHHVTANETWSSDTRKGNIIIENGATLTLNSINLEILTGRKIIVEQGGKLIVNSSKISSHCGDTWQGIEVWGNRLAHQWPDAQGNLAQGYLELNNATIENAIVAVNLWKPDDYSATGGIIVADNSVFTNNRTSIQAYHYRNFHPDNEKEMDYRAGFTRCTFKIDENYHGAETFFKHVDLSRVNGVKFSACNFTLSSVAPNIADYNMGIGSYSAGFSATGICTVFGQDTCLRHDPITFSGLNWAINANNLENSTRTFNVNRAEFNNNTYGIRVSGINNFAVLNSEFHIGYNQPESDPCDSEGKAASSYGIHMTGCTGFAIEENHFTKASGATQGYYSGILIAESQSTEQVYRNTFEGLSYGNYAVGENWKDNYFKGLAYYCNENTGNYADFFVEPDNDEQKISGIQSKQGDDNFVTGNTFTSTGNTWHFFNGGDYLVGYYYCNYCDDEIPDEPKTFQVTDKPKSFNNNCPSHYGGGGGSTEQSIVLTTSEKQEAELEFAVNLSNYNGVKTLYDDLKDGGNTDAVIADIENAWPTDTWELRAELLGKSPHLSMEVLKAAADKTDVLPESIIFEVLAANPDELKKEELIKYLEDKADPLPEYMVNILRHLAQGTTYKTTLEQHMAHYNQVKTRAAYDIVRSLLNDTISDPEQLRNWLDNVGGKRADEQIIATYLAENNYTNALALANMMPSLYAYSGNELTEHSFYMDMLNQQINLEQQQRSIFDLDSLEVANLIFIAETSQGTAGLQAKGILEYAYGHQFCNCLNINDMSGLKRSGPINPDDLAKLHGVEVNAHPNPASQWVAFNYTLPANAYQGEIKIVDAKGAVIDSFTVTGAQGQQVWDTRSIKPGVYFYTLSVGEFTKTGKLLINK